MPRLESRRAAALISAASLAATLGLAACETTPQRSAICADGSSAEASWPHCAPNEPGGRRDDRINPRGG